MSGLERFQGTSDWIQKLKSLLSTNRDSRTPPRDLDTSDENSVCLELNEELHNLVQEKIKIPKSMTTSFKAENKENMIPTANETNKNFSYQRVENRNHSIYNDSLMNPSFIDYSSKNELEITNISFTEIERACNKSISDPDSTIHNYVEQIRQKSEIKNSNITDSSLAEDEAIDRLIKNIEAEELKYKTKEVKSFSRVSECGPKLRTTMGFADQTQLADIEEPSVLWETSVLQELKYQLSPTKMVGLLRPSTILEESTTSSLAESNITENSYNTAQKLDSDQTNVQSDTTSTYETACESARSECNNIKVQSTSEQKNSFMKRKHKFYDDEPTLSTNENSQSTTYTSLNDSLNNNDANSSSNDDQKSEVIHLHSKLIKQEISVKENLNNLEESPLVIELSDDEAETETQDKNSSIESENLNEGFSLQTENIDENTTLEETLSETNLKYDKDLNVSREFNDTLEEVEYIMKHGMQMLKNSATKPKIVESVEITPKEMKANNSCQLSNTTNSRGYLPSPAKSYISSGYSSINSNKTTSEKLKNNKSPTYSPRVFSPKIRQNTAPAKNSPNLIKTIAAKQLSANKKLATSTGKDLFRKPALVSNSTRIPQPKLLNNIKKSHYADVISPVSAYINKTSVYPTATNIKETTIKSLDYGQATGKAHVQHHIAKKFEVKKGNGPSLPQKCYTSAEYRCVVDERTPLNIPGGDKIHKYLKSALLPSVVRHDGKMKMDSPMQYAEIHKNDINRTVDSTMTDLADLSTISGDVSIYTLKDAQKFSNLHKGNYYQHGK